MGERFLLVKGGSGLGNRILVLASGILYARATGRTLLVDWRDGMCAPAGVNALPHLFEAPLCGPFDRLPETDSVRPAIWRGRLHEPVSRMIEDQGPGLDSKARRSLLSIDFSRPDGEEVLVLWGYTPRIPLLRRHLEGTVEDLASRSDDDILRDVMRSDFVPGAEIRERVEAFRRRHLAHPTVGVHVRFSDHRADLWSILRNLNVVLEREPDLQIFLATDNVEVKRLFEKSYPRVVTTPHWYPAPGRTIHSGARRRDPVTVTIEALVDLYLLAACEWLVFARSSSFGRLAKLLSTAPGERILEVRDSKGPIEQRQRVWRLLLRTGAFRWGLRLLPRVVSVRRL